MTEGVSPQDFLEAMESIQEVRIDSPRTNELYMLDRNIFVLQPLHTSVKIPKVDAYAHYYWTNFRNFKLAKTHYIELSKLPIVDFGILLNDNDRKTLLPTESKLIEYIQDLGYPFEFSSHNSGRDPHAGMNAKDGWLIHAPLNS